MTLSPLIEKLKAAEAGSRELDALVYLHFADERNEFIADDGAGVRYYDFERQGRHLGWDRVGNFTTSIDRAYQLICATLSGYGLALREDSDGCFAYLLDPKNKPISPSLSGPSPTPALALCIALCSALEDQRG